MWKLHLSILNIGFDLLMGLFLYKKYKTIAHNTAYLSVLEVFKMVMPFIALPYIIKTVGGDNYGLVVFAQAIISYFIILINFGLDISAVKDISINRNDHVKLSEIVSSVLVIKCVLFVISFAILSFLVSFIGILKSHIILYYLSFLGCLSEIMFPVWFYQGLEKMKYITIIRFSSILFYTIAVFLVVKQVDDYIYIPLLQSIGWIISGGISFYMLLKVEKITLFLPPIEMLKRYFQESIPFFISRISVVVNASMAKTICGFFFSMPIVAAFDLAQKIANAAFIPLQMLNQALYPHIAKTRDRKFTSKCFLFILALTLVIVVCVYFVAPLGVRLLSDGKLMDAVPILRALCLFILCGGISLYTGSPLLVSFGYPKPFNRSVILSTVVLIFSYLFLYLTESFSILNFAYVLGFAEFVIAFYRLYYCLRYRLISL